MEATMGSDTTPRATGAVVALIGLIVVLAAGAYLALGEGGGHALPVAPQVRDVAAATPGVSEGRSDAAAWSGDTANELAAPLGAGAADGARSALAGPALASGAAAFELRIAPPADAIRLTAPRFVVRDVDSGEQWTLADERVLALAADRPRTVELVADTPAWLAPDWMPVPARIELDPAGERRVDVVAEPMHRTLVSVRDAATRKPLTAFELSASWEWVEGCCPTRFGIEARHVETRDGLVLLEGLPARAEQLRVEAVSPDHFAARSAWTPVEPTGWLEVELALAPTATQSALVRIAPVAAPGGAVVPDVTVSVFAETAEQPITGFVSGPRGVEPLHAVASDNLPAEVATVRRSGTEPLEFHLRAPARYRIVARHPLFAEHRSAAIELAPGDERALEVLLDAGASIVGSVLVDRADPALAHVERLGSVELSSGADLVHAELDEQGRFEFAGLAAGEYVLAVNGTVARGSGSDAAVPLATRRIVLGAGERREIEIPIGSLAPGATVAGTLAVPVEPQRWGWLAALVRDDEATRARAATGGDVEPVQIVACGAEGAVQFSGVESGDYLVVALGQRDDGLAYAFGHTRLVVGDGRGSEFRIDVAPDVLELRAATTQGAQRLVTVRVECEDPLLRALAAELPPLQVHGATTSAYHGLPSGAVFLTVDGQPLRDGPVDRTRTVEVP
jgi:hypothetical protein